MQNLEIRAQIDNLGFRHWQLATCMGISPFTLSRWLRNPVTPTQREAINEGLDKLVKQRREKEGAF